MDQILTRREAAEMLKLPIRTVDYLIATGQIPFSRLGKRSVRFKHSRLLEWMDQREGVEYHTGRNSDETVAS